MLIHGGGAEAGFHMRTYQDSRDLAAASSSSVKTRSLCLARRKSKFLCFLLSSVFQKISMPKKAASRLNATYDPSFKIAAHSRGC
jgi:hypothetical protein